MRRELQTQVDRARECEPPRDEAMSLVIECWQTLDSDRPQRQAGLASYPGAIQYTAIDVWARRWGLDDEHMQLVVDVIRILDADRTERIHNELTTKG